MVQNNMHHPCRMLFSLLVLLLLETAIAFQSLIKTATPRTTPQVPEKIKLLILPGFGNDSIDYFLPEAPQGSLVKSLQNRGWKEDQIKVLPVQRSDWLQVFLNGLLDIKFYYSTNEKHDKICTQSIGLICPSLTGVC
mgnify:CR=1 FL=1